MQCLRWKKETLVNRIKCTQSDPEYSTYIWLMLGTHVKNWYQRPCQHYYSWIFTLIVYIAATYTNIGLVLVISNDMLQTLKLYAWEPSFEKKVNEARERELAVLKQHAILEGISYFISHALPFLVTTHTDTHPSHTYTQLHLTTIYFCRIFAAEGKTRRCETGRKHIENNVYVARRLFTVGLLPSAEASCHI